MDKLEWNETQSSTDTLLLYFHAVISTSLQGFLCLVRIASNCSSAMMDQMK